MRHFIQISLLLGSASLAFAGPKLAKDLPPSTSTGLVEVIVQFKNPPTKDQLKQLGAYGQMKKVFDGIKAALVTIPASLLPTLEADPSIVYVSPNRLNQRFLDVTTASVGAN